LASLIIASQGLDLTGHLVDALVEMMQVAHETPDHVHHSRGQGIGAVGGDVRERVAQEAQALPYGNTALEQKGPDLVDDGGALAD
jgi:hypothetical protein